MKFLLSNQERRTLPKDSEKQKAAPRIGNGRKEQTMNNEEKILSILGTVKAEQEAMKAEQANMSELLQKVAVTQEAVILPRLDLLAEGHTHLAETLAGKSRVEKLEDEMDFLKTVIKALSKEVAELKKAQ